VPYTLIALPGSVRCIRRLCRCRCEQTGPTAIASGPRTVVSQGYSNKQKKKKKRKKEKTKKTGILNDRYRTVAYVSLLLDGVPTSASTASCPGTRGPRASSLSRCAHRTAVIGATPEGLSAELPPSGKASTRMKCSRVASKSVISRADDSQLVAIQSSSTHFLGCRSAKGSPWSRVRA